jgi:hypothetical protein
MAGPGGNKKKMNSSNKPVKMTMLAKKSLAIQKKKLAKCAAASKSSGKKCSLKKMSRLRKNISALNSTGKTKVRRGADKAIKVGTKVANSKTGKVVQGAVKLAKNIKNLDAKGAVNTIKKTAKDVKNAESVINYSKIIKKKK